VVALVAACGHSVLIRDDDLVYRRAIDRYQRARRLVTESLAPDEDQAIFLQAEGLYRYRFARPARSFGSYLAQGASAVVALPALDSLAGSLDLFSLRLKTYDGAVHLWETLLARSPKTPLRALALYRLGWAYRNSIASGFPRSSDKAFDAIVADRGELAPLAVAAKRVKRKSQGRATAWSIVPGLGQMYVGEYKNGAVRLAIALAAAAAITVPAVIAIERHGLDFSRDWPFLLTGIVGATVLVIDYSSSYNDAMRGVLEYNERREREFEDAHPEAP
jgi:hypothetical protein